MPHRTPLLRAVLGALVLALTCMTALAKDIRSLDDKWWPSKWGADDELGSFNLLSPELTLKAAKLIKTGKTYRLGIETNRGTPAFPPRTFQVQILMPNQAPGQAYGDNKFNYADDIIAGWMGVGTQIDGLGHAAIDHIYYNGWHSKDFVDAAGLTKFGVEQYPGVVAPGLMLDMASCMGKQILPAGTPINSADIKACEEKQGTPVEEGDVVILHTGWMNLLDGDPEQFGKSEPGLGVDGAIYLASKNVVAVGADTWGLEVLPFEKPNIKFRVHQILITENGVYILENIDTRELAKDKAYRFMFTLGAARMSGAVQMIINPIAIR